MSYFILWAEEEGGFYKAFRGATREQYDDAVRTGVLKVPGPRGHEQFRPAFIAFGAVEANHDFRMLPEPGPRPKEMV